VGEKIARSAFRKEKTEGKGEKGNGDRAPGGGVIAGKKRASELAHQYS